MKSKVTAARGPDRLILIAGILFLIDSFLPWYGVSAGPFSVNVKGWSAGGFAVLAILFAIAALAFAAIRMAGTNMTMPMKDGMVYLVLGGGCFLFVLLRLITESSFTKFGLYIALVLGAILAYAGYMKYKADA